MVPTGTVSTVMLTSLRTSIKLFLVRLRASALFLPVFSQALHAQSSPLLSQYTHTAWKIQDGFFSSGPTAIAQTVDGYLWIGTSAGIERFDGLHFRIPPFIKDSQMPSVSIFSLLGTRDGSLYVGTESGLVQWKDNHLTSFPAIRGRVTDISEDLDGNIWIGQSRVGSSRISSIVCEVSGGRTKCLGPDDHMPALSNIFPLAIDLGGTVWVGDSTKIVHWSPGSTTTYEYRDLQNNLDMDGVTSIALASNGTVWVGKVPNHAGAGLVRYVDGVAMPSPELSEISKTDLKVTALLLDQRNDLWIGTENEGLLRLSDGRVQRYNASNGLSSDSVIHLFQDHEGTLWIATTKGLDKLRRPPIITFSKQEGLAIDEVDSVLATNKGEILVGTPLGINIVDAISGAVRSPPHSPHTQVTALFQDGKNRMWEGFDNNLFVQEHGKLRRLAGIGGQPMGLVTGLSEDNGRDIWGEITGAEHKLVHIRNDNIIESFSESQVPGARSLAQDARGGIWLGLRSGDIAHFRDGQTTVERFQHADAERSNALIVDSGGTVLDGTTYGLAGFKAGTKRIMAAVNGLPCDEVDSLVFDDHQNLWMSMRCALVELSAEQLQQWWDHPGIQVRARVFDYSEGFQPGLAAFHGATRSKDGRLWFANGTVLQMIDPALASNHSQPPPVYLEQVIADRKVFDGDPQFRLPALTRQIEIDYTALNFIAPQKVHFRYQLIGHDTLWQDADTRRQAFYNDLPPGTYHFQVIASNGDGIWSEPRAAATILIAPKFYQTAWFKSVAILGSVVMLWLLYLLRLKQATAEVQLRLGERMIERERIARELHDTLLQGFQGLMLKFQAVIMNLADQDLARTMLESALDRGDKVLVEGRMRVMDLRDEEFMPQGFPEALLIKGQEFAELSSSIFGLTVIGTPKLLNPILREELFRIGIEAISNAFRHANAARIEVEITYGPNEFRLNVHDDGCGMGERLLREGRTGHWGLPGMRERAEKVGARLSIWSTPRAGTEMDVVVPVTLAYFNRGSVSAWTLLKRAVNRGKSI
ncbi:sensor histidine kinase [Granulicella arctica]|uniref:sensor histidine kinase n=1 Tax=Granulicella arctica TaxID=940613 RepID=UPI0021DFDF79|nr:sensor histidine kinase [Granulicella arctica]